MRDHDDGHPGIFLDFAKQREDGFTGGTVEIAGGLVGKKNSGAIDQRAGDGRALLLPAGKLARAMADALFEFDALKRFAHPRRALGAVDFGEAQRELDVFFERHAREEIEGLKNHAHGLPPVAGKFLGGHFREILAVRDDRAGAGTIEPGDEIEKRGFSGAGAAEKREKLTRWNGERDFVDRADEGFAHDIVAGDGSKLDRGRKLGHRLWGPFIIRRSGRGNFTKVRCRVKPDR